MNRPERDMATVACEAIATSSTKSMGGHALGAAGALEIVATIMAVREGIAPPTIGHLGPDPDCDLDYVPNEARSMQIEPRCPTPSRLGGSTRCSRFGNSVIMAHVHRRGE
jgi:hypothetical protein